MAKAHTDGTHTNPDVRFERTDAEAGGRHDPSGFIAHGVAVAALDAVVGLRQARRQIERGGAVRADGDEIRYFTGLLHQGALLEVVLYMSGFDVEPSIGDAGSHQGRDHQPLDDLVGERHRAIPRSVSV